MGDTQLPVDLLRWTLALLPIVVLLVLLVVLRWTAPQAGPMGMFTAAVVALLATAATAHRRRAGSSPYLGRLADILDVTAVVALAPVACAVLDLFTWVRGLAG